MDSAVRAGRALALTLTVLLPCAGVATEGGSWLSLEWALVSRDSGPRLVAQYSLVCRISTCELREILLTNCDPASPDAHFTVQANVRKSPDGDLRVVQGPNELQVVYSDLDGTLVQNVRYETRSAVSRVLSVSARLTPRLKRKDVPERVLEAVVQDPLPGVSDETRNRESYGNGAARVRLDCPTLQVLGALQRP